MEDRLNNNKVQERIKKMMKQKRMAKQNQSLSELEKRKRSTSQTVLQANQNLGTLRTDDQELSIKTQWKKRSIASNKYRDTQNSQTTNQTRTNDHIHVQKIVKNIFQCSPKLSQFCEQHGFKKQEAIKQLLSNQLFSLSLSNKLLKIGIKDESLYNSIVQNQIILKLTKINRKKKQSLSYFDVEHRIKNLINGRLQTLRKY